MITLYGFGSSLGVPDPSPFVLKAAAFLKLAGLEYRYDGKIENMRRAPKGKLPYIDDEGTQVADSTFIADYLTQKYDLHLDTWLSEEQAAQAWLIGKSLEDHLYWPLLYSRWISDESWPELKKALFAPLPAPLRLLVPGLARRDLRKALHAQGTGRHSDAEIRELLERNASALATMLGDKPWFFGDQPCSFDATAFGFVGAAVLVEIETSFKEIFTRHQNLLAWAQGVQGNYFANGH